MWEMSSLYNSLSTLTKQTKVNTGCKNNITGVQKEIIQRKLLDAVDKNDLIYLTRKLYHVNELVDSLIGGTTLLCSAVQKNKYGIVKLLLFNGANPNKTDDSHTSPLHYAVTTPSNYITTTLLRYGANPLQKDSNNMSALDLSSNDTTFTECLKHLPDLNALPSNFPTKDLKQSEKLAFRRALRERNIAALNILKSRSVIGDSINQQDINGDTNLHLALKSRDYKLAYILIGFNARCDLQNSLGDTAIHIMVRQQKFQILMHLFQFSFVATDDSRNKWLEILKIRNNVGSTSLHEAVHVKNVKFVYHILHELCSCIDQKLLTIENDQGESPVHLALKTQNKKLTVALFKAFVEIKNFDEHSKKTMKNILNLIPLWRSTPIYFQYIEKVIDQYMQYAICEHAIINRYSDALDYLLKNGIRYDIKDDSEKNLLHVAAQYGSLEEIKVLLKNGGNVRERNQKTGDLPLHYAALTNTLDVVTFLSQLTINICFANLVNQTPLHKALILKRDAVASILIDAMPYMWFEDLDGNSPLHLVLLNFTSIRNIRQLIAKVTSIRLLTVENKKGESPLLLALRLKNIDLMKYIFDKIPGSMNTKYITDSMCSKLLQNQNPTENTIEFFRLLFQEFRSKGYESGIFEISVKLIYQSYKYGFNDLAQFLIQENSSFTTFMYRAVFHKLDRNFIKFLAVNSEDGGSHYNQNQRALNVEIVAKEEKAVRFLLRLFTDINVSKEDKISCLVMALEDNTLRDGYLNHETLNEISKLLIETLRSNFYNATNCFLDFLENNVINVDTLTLSEAIRAYDGTEESKSQLNRLLKLVDENVLDKNGKLALNVAVKLNKKQVDDMLFKSYASINIPDSNGLNPIYYAIQGSHYEITNLFLLICEKNSIAVDTSNLTEAIKVYDCTEESKNQLNRLLKLVDVNVLDKNGELALSVAVKLNKKQVVDMLCENYASINIPDSNGFNPIYYAIQGSHYEITNLFLLICEKNSIAVDTSNLTEAIKVYDCTKESKNQLNRLLKLVDENVLDKNGELALSVAVNLNKKQVVDMLCENYASINIPDSNGFNPIYYAIKGSHYEITNLFLLICEKNSIAVDTSNLTEAIKVYDCTKESKNQLNRLLKLVDVNVLDKNGELALSVAVKLNKKQVVDMLCENYASINIPDSNGFNPIYYAIQGSHYEITNLFLLICEKNSIAVDTSNLTEAIKVYDCTEESRNQLNRLLKLVDVNVLDKNGELPLNIAVKLNKKHVINILCDKTSYDVSVNLSDGNGFSAIDYAIQRDDYKLTRILLSLLKEGDRRVNSRGNTLLHSIIEQSSNRIISQLYRQPEYFQRCSHINVNATNFDGNTPLDLALLVGNEVALDYLLIFEADLSISTRNKQKLIEIFQQSPTKILRMIELLVKKQIPEEMECPICNEISQQMFTCVNGHSICDQCAKHPSIENCPMCRVRFKGNCTCNIKNERWFRAMLMQLERQGSYHYIPPCSCCDF
ncbi:ankyrin-1-like [Hydractinia symbiolongicarpus]|uniref:ankyrin-1-like n=1 Tax=Hydractinia symbiolongicarpus TaxID=13093 RepID=UPI00254CB4C0|nr:ankyrin-1-like [Hydractinia symbiolongicarpus]